nr:hypothetical protein [Bradyrhizobium sp. CCBAU 51765]
MLDDQRIAMAEIDLHVMTDLARGIDERLKGWNVEVADVDAIARFEPLDRVHAHALAEQELIVALIAAEMIPACVAKEQIPSAAAMQVVIAIAADQGVIAGFAEQRIVSLASVDPVIAAATENDVIAETGVDRIIAAEAEDDVAVVRPWNGVVSVGPELDLFERTDVVMIVVVIVRHACSLAVWLGTGTNAPLTNGCDVDTTSI